MNKKQLFSILCCASFLCSNAKVILPEYLTSNMVIQRESSLVIKGETTLKKAVTITASWSKKTYTAQPDIQGKFRISLPTPKAGGPFSITIDDGEQLTLKNILSGEVWFCSGQSNMEMPVKGWGKVKNFEEELRNANHPQIRLLQSRKVVAHKPTEHASLNMTEWQECNSQSVENFSAVAYFFARELRSRLGVPIGVIDSSWGGTPAEAWTSIDALKGVYRLQTVARDIEKADANDEALNKLYAQMLDDWQKEYIAADKGYANGKPQWVSAEQTGNEWKTMQLPGYWEDRGLPGFDGCVWFQRTINIPQSWEGKELTLNAGKIDDNDVVYFNGEVVGQTDGYWIQRTYKVPANLAKSGKAIITVRVQDNSGGGGIYGNPDDMNITCGDEKISLSGEWKYAIGAKLAYQPQRPKEPNHPNFPANLYNAMVYPFRDFNIKGVIWYQGEENSSRWKQYTPLFQTLICDWRKLWGYEFPFYFVQLANWQDQKQVQSESTWAHLREAQTNALQLPKTNMAVILDIGEAYDIHPKNKQEVARRLALAAMADTYHIGKYQVPFYTDMRVEGNKAIITFNQKLSVRSGEKEITGFVMAGPDMKFHKASATIIGNKAIVTCPEVSIPIAVRYAWADNPANNLQGDGNLPVAPFRTDRFEE